MLEKHWTIIRCMNLCENKVTGVGVTIGSYLLRFKMTSIYSFFIVIPCHFFIARSTLCPPSPPPPRSYPQYADLLVANNMTHFLTCRDIVHSRSSRCERTINGASHTRQSYESDLLFILRRIARHPSWNRRP